MRLTRWLYLRSLGAVSLIAVVSFWAQLSGLIGSEGIWPAVSQMSQLHAEAGRSFFDVPTLAWLSASDPFLHALAAACTVLSLLLIANVFPRGVLALLWVCWLSLVHVGGPFLSFQWDVLLVEAFFFSIFFAPPGLRPKLATEPEPPAWSCFLLQWLAFKLTFSSGVVKLMSGDPSWRDLTALSYHYWTQPLPTWTSYLANQWPMFVHRISCLVMFLGELPIAAFALGPRKLRLVSATGMVVLQAGLAAAGNYAYFNLLTVVLCLPLIDDAALALLFPKWKLPVLPLVVSSASVVSRRIGATFAGLVALAGVLLFFRGGEGYPKIIQTPLNAIYPFSTINTYGAFAWMTKTRPEIILEASSDGVTWAPWEFKYKPGKLDVRPGFIAPWQPRLDWQMWFAALGDCNRNRWLVSLQYKLLQGSAPVEGLLGESPFPGVRPKFLRTTTWDYRFAPVEEKGVWWARENPRPYCPALTLDDTGQLTAVQP